MATVGDSNNQTLLKSKNKAQVTNRTMMNKKFKGGEGSTFVEQSILLEPGNVKHDIEDEEKKEVSQALSQLRKKYDEVKQLVTKKENELENIKKEIGQLSDLEDTVEDSTYKVSSKVEQLQNALELTKIKHEEELMNKQSYEHMIDRLKKDIIALQITSNSQEDNLRSKNMVYGVEVERAWKTKQEKVQSKEVLNSLMKNIDEDQKKRQDTINNLTKSIKDREEVVMRRMERIRRQQEIAEAAANENNDSSEIKMRENFLVQKCWNGFLKRKMEREMRKAVGIEDAFQKIRAATGLTDVQDIVHKFLTREQTYSQLLVAVAEAERKIDTLKKENEVNSDKLKDLQIANEGIEAQITSPELQELNNELTALRKESHHVLEKYQKVEIVHDQVAGWGTKILQKLENLLNRTGSNYSPAIQPQNNTRMPVPELFEKISVTVSGQLENFAPQDGQGKPIMSRDFLQDFATDEFINKNIRVRPVSSALNMDETRGLHGDGSKSVLITEPVEDEHDNFNKMAHMELDEKRKAIKQKARERDAIKKKKIEKKEDKQPGTANAPSAQGKKSEKNLKS